MTLQVNFTDALKISSQGSYDFMQLEVLDTNKFIALKTLKAVQGGFQSKKLIP
jgi:hypothetical protein